MTTIPGDPWISCDGIVFKELVQAGLFWLEKNHRIVNELNVFPVPDGDTGTNMLLTMRSALRAIKEKDETHAGTVAQAFARGALMGARGNSGVILSQIWRGIGRSLAEKAVFNGQDLAQALEAAVETAYGGVMKPVEGTILTVIREGAEEAVDAAEKSNDIRFVMRRTLTRFRQALERTPDLLPILKQAGVVDSGGQGLVYIFEGMYRYAVDGLPEMAAAGEGDHFEATVAALPAQAHAVPEGGVLENHYDVQFLLMGQNLNVDLVRTTIDAMGDSTVVVGDETTIKVHVHVDNPGEPISYGISLGEITDVVIENMQMQMDEIVMAAAAPTATAQERAQQVQIEPGQIAVVTVAPGAGFETLFRDLGAAGIVPGGQTNNPSTEELVAAIEATGTDKIILLPNNKNIILACEAARDICEDKSIAVVPTRSVPQGISAMLALNPAGDLEEVAAAMKAMADDVVTVQVTIATRTVELNGVAVAEGNVIGLVEGQIVAAGENIMAVLKDSLGQIADIDDRELVSLYYGVDTTAEEAGHTAELIEEWYEELEVEVQPGGQAHYFYILGVE